MSGPGVMLLAAGIVSSLLVTTALAQPVDGQGDGQVTPSATKSSYRPGVPESARDYYESLWGIDNLLVRQTASGNLIRFSYRVTEPARAKALNDKKATPYLYGQRSQALLQIPVMDKVGPLRQTLAPEAGKQYWMTFSNKGGFVKAGDRVDVVIGLFRAEGLVVE